MLHQARHPLVFPRHVVCRRHRSGGAECHHVNGGLTESRSIRSTEHISLTGRETLPPKDISPLVEEPSWARPGPARSRHVLKARLGGTSWHRRSACWPEGHLDPHCHSAPSVQPRVSGTATRPWPYHLGTLDIEWQCETHCPVRPPSSGSVSGTATRPRAYRPV